jgi:tetratricopeptide (TPR) repeat protein
MTTLATPAVKKPAAPQHPRSKVKDQADLIGAAARSSYPRTHFEKGLYYKQIRNLNDALVEFLKATQENPRLVRGFYEQALIFRQRGYLKLAESALEQALAAKPDYSDARVLLATVRIQQGDVGGAVQELSRTLGLNIEDEKDGHKGNSPAVPIVLQSIHKAIKQEQGQIPRSVLPKPSGASRSETASKQGQQKNENSDQSNTSNTDQDIESTKPQNAARRYDLSNVKDSIESALRSPFSNKWRLFSFAATKDSNAKNGSEITNQDESSNNEDSEKSEPPKRKKRKAKRSQREDAATTVDTTKENVPKKEKGKKRRFHFRRSTKEETNTANQESNSTAPENSDLVQSPDVPEKHASQSKSERTASARESANRLERAASTNSMSKTVTPSRRERTASANSASETVTPSRREGTASANSASDTVTPSRRERAASAKEAAPLITSETGNSVARTPGEMPEPSSVQGNKLAFQLPNLEAAGHGLFNSFAPSANSTAANAATPLKQAPAVHLDADSWAKKMKYLMEHGTSSLKDGEAFMFSEETGEGVLFLGDGQVIRRTVAEPRDAQDVVRERRPDIIAPTEVLYNLSLLGKLMPKSEAGQQQPQQPQPQADHSGGQTLAPPQHGDFKVDDLMGNSQGFWGWLKSVLKL